MKTVFIHPSWHAKGQNTPTLYKNKQHLLPSKVQYEHSCLKHLSNAEDRQHATKEHTQHELGDGPSDKPVNWLENLCEEPIGRCFISPKYINCLKKCSSGERLCLLASVCHFPLLLFCLSCVLEKGTRWPNLSELQNHKEAFSVLCVSSTFWINRWIIESCLSTFFWLQCTFLECVIFLRSNLLHYACMHVHYFSLIIL